MPGGLTLLAGTSVSIPTPPAGKVTIFFNTDTSLPSYKDSAGITHSLVGAAGVQGSAGIQGEQGEEPDIVLALPGPQGNQGIAGPAGPMGPVMLFEEPVDGEDGIPGARGPAGSSDWDQTIIKAANESVTNSSAYIEDAELRTILLASGVYLVEAYIIFSCNSTAADYKWEWRLGANVVSANQWHGYWTNFSGPTDEAGSNSGANCFWGNLNIAMPLNTNDRFVMQNKFMVVVPATTTSDFALRYRFAQVVATVGTSAITYAGSMMRWKKLS